MAVAMAMGARRRRRSPAVAPDSRGKEGEEGEESVGKLTGRSNRAEVDRRMGIDGRGGARREHQWRLAMAGSIPAGKQHDRAREEVE